MNIKYSPDVKINNTKSNKIMKNLTLILLFLGLNTVLYGQFGKLDMVEIRIYSTENNTSIKWLREGLLYRTVKEIDNQMIDMVKFIPFNKIDPFDSITHKRRYKMYEIQKYIHNKRLYEIETLDNPVNLSIENLITIEFIDLLKGKYTKLYYYKYDKRFNNLIKLINELIPKEDRKEFCIKPPFKWKNKKTSLKY